MSKEWHQRNST